MRTKKAEPENETMAGNYQGDIPGASRSLWGRQLEKIGSDLQGANCGGFEHMFKALFMQLDIQTSISSLKWEIRLVVKSTGDSVGAEEWRGVEQI